MNSLVGEISHQSLAWSFFEESSDLVKDSDQVQRLLGIPLKSFGNDSSDSRIRNSLNYIFHDENDLCQMNFIIQGPKGKAQVNVEKKKVDGKWDYTQLIVSSPFGQVIPLVLPSNPSKSGYFRFSKLYKWT